MEEILKAKITSVSLSMTDHGCLTFWVTLDVGGGWEVSIGGYVIGHGLEAMMRIMNVVGVEKWEDLEGKCVRVKTEGFRSTVHTIGNVLKDEWFDLKEFFEDKKNERNQNK